MEKGANANDVYVDEGGDRHSLLMDAIIVENVPFAELLVKHGAGVSVTDEQGVTTLIQVRQCSPWIRLLAAVGSAKLCALRCFGMVGSDALYPKRQTLSGNRLIA